MKYYSEISHIVNGALTSYCHMVMAYIQQLADKLTAVGEAKAAKGLTQKLSQVNPPAIQTQ